MHVFDNQLDRGAVGTSGTVHQLDEVLGSRSDRNIGEPARFGEVGGKADDEWITGGRCGAVGEVGSQDRIDVENDLG